MNQRYGATPPTISKEMVPSVPSEQVVGVVLILVISRFWATSGMVVKRDNRMIMEYLIAFIRARVRAIPSNTGIAIHWLQACTLVQTVIKIELLWIGGVQSFKQYLPFRYLPGTFWRFAEPDTWQPADRSPAPLSRSGRYQMPQSERDKHL